MPVWESPGVVRVHPNILMTRTIVVSISRSHWVPYWVLCYYASAFYFRVCKKLSFVGFHRSHNIPSRYLKRNHSLVSAILRILIPIHVAHSHTLRRISVLNLLLTGNHSGLFFHPKRCNVVLVPLIIYRRATEHVCNVAHATPKRMLRPAGIPLSVR